MRIRLQQWNFNGITTSYRAVTMIVSVTSKVYKNNSPACRLSNVSEVTNSEEL